ncbi:MAG: PAS domain-containing methyl-accepting chemotaxis protein, partial [Planctomycetota bacterium]
MSPTDTLSASSSDRSVRAQMRAIDRVMAVIEFDLDGKILHANENFLAVMGYTLNEVKGQHHRIFVEHDFASSSEYRQHWERLRQGEFVVGQFKRLSKSGGEVWIKASYNPLLDASGDPYGFIKYATDVTHEVLAAREQASFIEEASAVLNRASDGDLTARMQARYDGELSPLKETINRVVSSMAEAMETIVSTSSPLASASEELSATSDQLREGSANVNDRARAAHGGTESVAFHISN